LNDIVSAVTTRSTSRVYLTRENGSPKGPTSRWASARANDATDRDAAALRINDTAYTRSCGRGRITGTTRRDATEESLARSVGHWGEGVFVRSWYGWPIGARACACTHISRASRHPRFRQRSRPLPIISRHTAGIIFHLDHDRSSTRRDALIGNAFTHFRTRAVRWCGMGSIADCFDRYAEGEPTTPIDTTMIIIMRRERCTQMKRGEEALRQNRRKWRECNLINRRSLSLGRDTTTIYPLSAVLERAHYEYAWRSRKIGISRYVWIMYTIYINSGIRNTRCFPHFSSFLKNNFCTFEKECEKIWT